MVETDAGTSPHRSKGRLMADTLSEKARQLIARPILASLTTLSADGSPQVTPLWIDRDGDDLVFNTAKGRVKARHMEHDPRVAVSVVDPDDPYNVVALRGTVTDMTTDGADAHIDALAKKYMGLDSYPMRQEGEVRIKVRVRTDHIAMQGWSSGQAPGGSLKSGSDVQAPCVHDDDTLGSVKSAVMSVRTASAYRALPSGQMWMLSSLRTRIHRSLGAWGSPTGGSHVE
jgi:PPOX class probable F420-dependent enzyme